MIRLLVYMLLFYVGFRVVRTLMGRTPSRRESEQGGGVGRIDDVMIQDPVCGVYFPMRDGVYLKHEGRDMYFCSPECKDTYLKQNEKSS
jgi:uncharacterized protein